LDQFVNNRVVVREDAAIVRVEADETIMLNEKAGINRRWLETEAFEAFGKVNVPIATGLLAAIEVAL
jgi:hydrogenase maturation factor HypF (carbamoyltransferase family)